MIKNTILHSFTIYYNNINRRNNITTKRKVNKIRIDLMKKYHESTLNSKRHKNLKSQSFNHGRRFSQDWPQNSQYVINTILSNNDCLAKNCENQYFILSHKEVVSSKEFQDVNQANSQLYKSVHSKSKIFQYPHLIYPTDIYTYQLISYECFPMINEKVKLFSDLSTSKYAYDRESLLIIKQFLSTISEQLIKANLFSPNTYIEPQNIYFYKKNQRKTEQIQLQFFLLMKKRQNSHMVLKRSERSMQLLINSQLKNLNSTITTQEQIRQKLILKKIGHVLTKVMFKKQSTSQTSHSSYHFMEDRPFTRQIIKKCMDQKTCLTQILNSIEILLESNNIKGLREKRSNKKLNIFKSTTSHSKSFKKSFTEQNQTIKNAKSTSKSVENYHRFQNTYKKEEPQQIQKGQQNKNLTKSFLKNFVQLYKRPKNNIYYTHQLRRFSSQSATSVINEGSFLNTRQKLRNNLRLTNRNKQMRLLSQSNFMKIQNHDKKREFLSNKKLIVNANDNFNPIRKKQYSEVLRQNMQKRIRSSQKEQLRSIFKGKINIEKMNITIRTNNQTQKNIYQKEENIIKEQNKKSNQNLTNMILKKIDESRKKLQAMEVFDQNFQKLKIKEQNDKFNKVIQNEEKILNNFLSDYKTNANILEKKQEIKQSQICKNNQKIQQAQDKKKDSFQFLLSKTPIQNSIQNKKAEQNTKKQEIKIEKIFKKIQNQEQQFSSTVKKIRKQLSSKKNQPVNQINKNQIYSKKNKIQESIDQFQQIETIQLQSNKKVLQEKKQQPIIGKQVLSYNQEVNSQKKVQNFKNLQKQQILEQIQCLEQKKGSITVSIHDDKQKKKTIQRFQKDDSSSIQFQEKESLIESYKKFREKICVKQDKEIVNITQIIQKSKSNQSSLKSSKHVNKPLTKVIDDYINVVNILGQLIVKYIKVKDSFFKSNQAWICVSILAYHRFYVQRKRIQYMIDKTVPRLYRACDKIKKSQWQKWVNSVSRQDLFTSVKQANIKILNSLQKLLKKNKNQQLNKKVKNQIQKNLYKYESDFTKQLFYYLDEAYIEVLQLRNKKQFQIIWDFKTLMIIIAQFDKILQEKELFQSECLNSLKQSDLLKIQEKKLQNSIQNINFKHMWQIIYSRYDF